MRLIKILAAVLVASACLSSCSGDPFAEFFKKDKIRSLQSQKPANPEEYVARGKQFVELGEEQLALADFSQALALNNGYLPGRYSRGMSYLRLGLFGNAERDFDFSIKADRLGADAYLGRGVVHLTMGHGRMAISDFQGMEDLNIGNSDGLVESLIVLSCRMNKEEWKESSVLEAALKQVSDKKWSYQVLRYLAKQISPDQLASSTIQKDEQTNAHAVIALECKLEGKNDQALPHLNWVKENGDRLALLYPLAENQLKQAN